VVSDVSVLDRRAEITALASKCPTKKMLGLEGAMSILMRVNDVIE